MDLTIHVRNHSDNSTRPTARWEATLLTHAPHYTDKLSAIGVTPRAAINNLFHEVRLLDERQAAINDIDNTDD